MAKQTRKPAKSPPVTSHPLFPAVVALWFGALFGLGSLAVRPTLIESLVLKSHIDLIIPATAPPLGVTARILIALLLAGVGGVLGTTLARRIARPKAAEPIKRKRGAKGISSSAIRYRARDAHPDAPARAPISAHAEFGGELGLSLGSGTAAPAIIAMRRRALANEEQLKDFVPPDLAPLPGTAPQILNIGQIGLNEPAATVLGSHDLGKLTQAAPSSAPLDWANAVAASAPAAPTALPAAIAAQRQIFQPDDLTGPATPQPTQENTAVHADGRQAFGIAPPAGRTEEPRQIFGVAVTNDHVPQDFVKAAGYQTTVFDVAEPSPLFSPRSAAAELAASSEPTFAASPAPTLPIAPAAMPVSAAPLPSPANLGMTDLATRLADAMRRRRAGAAAQALNQTTELAAAQTAAEPAELAIIAPIPAAYEPAALARDSADAAAVPAAYAVNPALAPIPAAFEPASFVPEFTALAPAAPHLAAPEPSSAPISLPSAMRPLALDAFLEEDAAFDSSLLPPRHIAMPIPAIAAAPPPHELVAELASEDEPADVPEEENYGSLLGLGAARNPFVRVDDPAADLQAAEPVVIFPGQAPLSAAPAPAFGAPQAATAEGSFRRFDAPATAGQGQPLAAASHALPSVDPAEAERALRAALSNLQRMSGAA